MQNLAELIPALQLAIGPVVLISGVGLLLLSMTNRLGRVIDRTRALRHAYVSAPAEQRLPIEKQIRIVQFRAHLIRSAILYAAISILCVAALIFAIFLFALMSINATVLIAILFSASMIALMVSLVYFLRDMYQALAAVEIDIDSLNQE